MGWFKKAFKKVKNVAGDTGKHLVNTLTAPAAVLIKGDLLYSGDKFKSKAWGKGWDKVKKPIKWTTTAGLALAGGIAAKDTLKGKEGDTTNSLTSTLSTKETSNNLLSSFVGGQTSGGFKDILNGLPSVSDLLNGALGGVKDTVSQSQTGEQIKEDAAKDWFQENWKTGALIASGVMMSVLTFLNLRK